MFCNASCPFNAWMISPCGNKEENIHSFSISKLLILFRDLQRLSQIYNKIVHSLTKTYTVIKTKYSHPRLFGLKFVPVSTAVTAQVCYAERKQSILRC